MRRSVEKAAPHFISCCADYGAHVISVEVSSTNEMMMMMMLLGRL